MKARMAALAVAFCFLGAVVCLAQNPNMGSWTLNEAKSKIGAGAPKNTTVVYEAAGNDIKVTVDGTDSAGNATHSEWTGKFDGKEYPLTGSSTADSRSYKRVSSHTLTFVEMKSGKVVDTGRIVVSADGKTRTLTLDERGAKGKKIHSVMVYDKQ